MTSRTQPTRRRLPASERRAAILDAALGVFARRGYAAASIDEIAGAARISKALIYEHFASKRELQVALLEANVAELFARLSASAATQEPGDVRLHAGVDAFLRFVQERRDAWRMLFRDATDPEVADALRTVQRQATTAVASFIAAEPSAPRTDDADAREAVEMLAVQLSGGVQALASWWADRPDIPRERLVEMAMDLAWVGLERLRAGERYGR